MKAHVDQDTCISCGLCVSTCPEVYSFDDTEKAVAIEGDVPSDQEASAQDAADGCPVDAISTSA
ncbi:ferredoxin [Lachnospiraceae bacterium KM106-2]|nr:ferredoxin [Lachnospiraceae bacterium KM106-2]